MSRANRTRRRDRGFTLIELMVSLVLFAFVTAGMLSVATTMIRGFREQEATISTESATRSGIDYVVELLRGASPGVPLSTIEHVNTCATGAFVLLNNQPTPLGNTADQLTVVAASGSVVTALNTPYTAGTIPITVVDASQFSAGDTVLITDLNSGHLARVASKAGSTLTLDAQTCGTLVFPSAGYLPGALVIRAIRAKFTISTLDGIPVLMMDPDAEGPRGAEPIAEGIESLEVALGIDTSGNGIVSEVGAAANDDEWVFNRSGEAAPGSLAALRAIRISLVARTPRQSPGVNSFVLPAVEDRAANVTPDNFRRRILSTIVEVRNLGGSP